MKLQLNEQTQGFIVKVGVFIILYLIFAKPVFNFLGITKSKNDRIREKEISSTSSPFLSSFYVGKVQSFSAARKNVCIDAHMKIFEAMGYFTDDENAIIAAFKTLRTQCEVSFVGKMTEDLTGKDLLTWLMKGKDIMPQNGISDYDLGIIISYVKKLPIR